MKRVTDYNEEELLGLNDNQIAKLIEVECMVEGVEEADPPGAEPTFGGNLQTKDFYQMSGTLLFPSMEAANQAASLATHEMEYTSLNGKYSAKPKSRGNIQVNAYYDYAELSAVRADKESFDKLHNQWESKKRAYEKYCDLRSKAESAVYDKVYDAQETVGTKRKRFEQYQKYLSLAEDVRIAGRFFMDFLVKQGWEEKEASAELSRVEKLTQEVH